MNITFTAPQSRDRQNPKLSALAARAMIHFGADMPDVALSGLTVWESDGSKGRASHKGYNLGLPASGPFNRIAILCPIQRYETLYRKGQNGELVAVVSDAGESASGRRQLAELQTAIIDAFVDTPDSERFGQPIRITLPSTEASLTNFADTVEWERLAKNGQTVDVTAVEDGRTRDAGAGVSITLAQAASSDASSSDASSSDTDAALGRPAKPAKGQNGH